MDVLILGKSRQILTLTCLQILQIMSMFEMFYIHVKIPVLIIRSRSYLYYTLATY